MVTDMKRQHDLKMIRGGQHWNRRSRDDVLPDDVLREPNRMDEVEYYKKFMTASKEDVEKFVEWTIGKTNKEIFNGAKAFELTKATPKPKEKK